MDLNVSPTNLQYDLTFDFDDYGKKGGITPSSPGAGFISDPVSGWSRKPRAANPPAAGSSRVFAYAKAPLSLRTISPHGYFGASYSTRTPSGSRSSATATRRHALQGCPLSTGPHHRNRSGATVPSNISVLPPAIGLLLLLFYQ